MKKVLGMILVLLMAAGTLLTGSLAANRRLEPQLWGLGVREEAHFSLDRPYDWYIDQLTTGEYGSINCGPTCAVMAAKWHDPDFDQTVEDARAEIEGTPRGWRYSDISSYLASHLTPSLSCMGISKEAVVNQLNDGNLVIVVVSIADLTYQPEPSYHTGRFYIGSSTHFIILKGYRVVDGITYFEAYDPSSLLMTYENGEYRGKDRYYLASDIIYTVTNTFDYYLVVFA